MSVSMSTINLVLQHLAEIRIHAIEFICCISEVVQERPIFNGSSYILSLVLQRSWSRGSECWGEVAAWVGVWG